MYVYVTIGSYVSIATANQLEPPSANMISLFSNVPKPWYNYIIIFAVVPDGVATFGGKGRNHLD